MDLLALDLCRPPPSTPHRRLQPTYTPLRALAWAPALVAHPDRAFVRFLISGIREGFRIGCHCSMQLRSASRNMHSASEHPEVVQAYLEKECALGRMRAAGPSPMPHKPVRGHPQGPEHGERSGASSRISRTLQARASTTASTPIFAASGTQRWTTLRRWSHPTLPGLSWLRSTSNPLTVWFQCTHWTAHYRQWSGPVPYTLIQGCLSVSGRPLRFLMHWRTLARRPPRVPLPR